MAVKRYNGTAWVTEAGGVPATPDAPELPSGMLAPFAGSTAPDGWLLSDGTAISRTTYASLFAIIGTTYGSGNGTTTFNLPDLRGRVAAGLDNMGGTDAGRLDITNTAGTVVGSQYVTLSSANLPTHTHTINHDHGAFGTTDGAGTHQHVIDSGGHYYVPGGTAFEVAYSRQPQGTSFAGAHNHTVDVPNFNGSSGDGGFANSGHNNMQPTMVMNYIIKT